MKMHKRVSSLNIPWQMKTRILSGLAFFLLFPLLSASNPQKAIVSPHYVFPEFTTGKILLKSGSQNELKLNYNSITEEMVFENQGKYLAITNMAEVDTIYILNRKFIPVANKFYEVLVNGKIPLLLRYICSVIPPGRPAPYGGTSQTNSTTNINKLYASGNTYDMTLPADYKVVPDMLFFLLDNGKLYRVSSVKQFTKLMPAKQQEIKQFVSKYKTDFKVQQDLISLTQFCNR